MLSPDGLVYGRRESEDASRAKSVGQYSYDSGVWMGNGQEPLLVVPEEAAYVPPTQQHLSLTPRPSTSVVIIAALAHRAPLICLFCRGSDSSRSGTLRRILSLLETRTRLKVRNQTEKRKRAIPGSHLVEQ